MTVTINSKPMIEAFYRSAAVVIALVSMVCTQPCLAGADGGAVGTGSKNSPVAADTALSANKTDPEQAKAFFERAEALRKAGQDVKAAEYYLKAGEADPSYYLAFHQLSVVKASPEQVDEGISRLTELRKKRPRELMLHVALSELLEKKGEYKNAAHTLVGLVYLDAVPPEFHTKVEARIHYLLVKARDKRAKEKTVKNLSDEELDIVPPPLPESPLKKELSPSGSKESRMIKGVGNARLVP